MALQRLRGRIGEEATEQLHAGEASAEDAVAACNALGLFGGEERLVVVDGAESWKAADVKELGAYLAAPAPTTVLVLVGDGIKRDSVSPRRSRKRARSSPTSCEEAASGMGRRAVRPSRRICRP